LLSQVAFIPLRLVLCNHCSSDLRLEQDCRGRPDFDALGCTPSSGTPFRPIFSKAEHKKAQPQRRSKAAGPMEANPTASVGIYLSDAVRLTCIVSFAATTGIYNPNCTRHAIWNRHAAKLLTAILLAAALCRLRSKLRNPGYERAHGMTIAQSDCGKLFQRVTHDNRAYSRNLLS
jgi:hypothetical protein